MQGAEPARDGAGRTRARSGVRAGLWLALLSLVPAACGDGGGVGPGTLRIGQLGEITVRLETPLRLGAGFLTQTLRWKSSGAWSVHEEISYRGLVGDETVWSSVGDPSPFASEYASLIVRINEVAGLELFIDELEQGTEADCGPVRTRIQFRVYDEPSNRTFVWTQCADGTLSDITPFGAGPDENASRLVVATQQARDATVGADFLSAYHGSVPFGTLARGEDTPVRPSAPFVITGQDTWTAFWAEHSGSATPPEVDFDEEVVIVAGVGERSEAGDSVEIRRVLEVGDGSIIHMVERIPGDFCSPIARSHYPYHVIVSPRIREPVRFADLAVELVPCGG